MTSSGDFHVWKKMGLNGLKTGRFNALKLFFVNILI